MASVGESEGLKANVQELLNQLILLQVQTAG